MIIIAAMAENRVIGAGDGIPWDVPAEYEQYRRIITDQTVVMGRRSFEIFGKDLTSRYAVVVSRSGKEIEEAMVCGSLDEALAKARSLGRTVYINGGQSIYEQAISKVDQMYLSIVKGEYSGDAYCPEFDEGDWEIEERREHDAFEFRRYRRRADRRA